MRTPITTSVLLAALSSPVAAQIFDARLELVAPTNVVATQGASTVAAPVLPTGFVIPTGPPTTQIATATWLGISSRSVTSISTGVTANSAYAQLRDSTQCLLTVWSFPSGGQCGTHSLILTITPRNGRQITGRIEITHDRLNAEGGTHGGSAAVGFESYQWNEALPTRAAPPPVVVPVTIPPRGMQIGMQTLLWTNTPTNGQFGRVLRVEFIANRVPYCRFTPYGTGCGPTLAGDESYSWPRRHLTYTVTGAPAMTSGVLTIGATRTAAPLGGGCFINTLPLVLVPLVTDATGQASLTFDVTRGLRGVFDTQAFVIDGPVLRGSPGLETDCGTWP